MQHAWITSIHTASSNYGKRRSTVRPGNDEDISEPVQETKYEMKTRYHQGSSSSSSSSDSSSNTDEEDSDSSSGSSSEAADTSEESSAQSSASSETTGPSTADSSSENQDESGDSSIDDDGEDAGDDESSSSVMKGRFETDGSSGDDDLPPPRQRQKKRPLRPTALGNQSGSSEEDDDKHIDVVNHELLSSAVQVQSSLKNLKQSSSGDRSPSLKRESRTVVPNKSSGDESDSTPKLDWTVVQKKLAKNEKSQSDQETTKNAQQSNENTKDSFSDDSLYRENSGLSRNQSTDSAGLSELQKDIRKESKRQSSSRERKGNDDYTNQNKSTLEKSNRRKSFLWGLFGRTQRSTGEEGSEKTMLRPSPEVDWNPSTPETTASSTPKAREDEDEGKHSSSLFFSVSKDIEANVETAGNDTDPKQPSDRSTAATAFWVCCFSLFLVGLGVGIAYFARDLILDDNSLPLATLSPTVAPLDTPPPTSTPTIDPLELICPQENVPVEFTITFDSEPRDVGIILREAGFGGPRVWSFVPGSFSSFTLFQRENYFLTCLPPGQPFVFVISDASENGLVAEFSGGANVYGQWELTYNGNIIAQYNGDCNAVPTANDDAALPYSSCGSYCECEFTLSPSTNATATNGTCNEVCL